LQKKSGRGGCEDLLDFPLFLRGVLEKTVCTPWFFAGENVVECVVNVVR
jgi:hypothetical protein